MKHIATAADRVTGHRTVANKVTIIYEDEKVVLVQNALGQYVEIVKDNFAIKADEYQHFIEEE